LKDQIRRASLSIMNNIAEGFTRFSSKEKVRFFEIAQSSASEVKSMFYLMEDLEYMEAEQAENFRNDVDQCQKQIWGLIKYLKR
ncbi:MAG: four helix bundle protein, partial [Bacteroidota bacterium]